MTIIADKPTHDPIADMKLVDAYMRWGIEAVRKVLGEEELQLILQEAGLQRFIDHPPSGEMIVTDVTFGDYANFNAALVNHFQQPGKTMVKQIGNESAQMAMDFQRNLFNVATVTAAKDLPMDVQLKMGLSAHMSGFRHLSEVKSGETLVSSLEDREEAYAYIVETCSVCAGKRADGCIGWLWEAFLEESCRLIFGQSFPVTEVECRAKGDPAGVWLVWKHPTEESGDQPAE